MIFELMGSKIFCSKMQDKDGYVTKNEFLAISSKITPAQVVVVEGVCVKSMLAKKRHESRLGIYL